MHCIRATLIGLSPDMLQDSIIIIINNIISIIFIINNITIIVIIINIVIIVNNIIIRDWDASAKPFCSLLYPKTSFWFSVPSLLL